jgi:hypothetical protein
MEKVFNPDDIRFIKWYYWIFLWFAKKHFIMVNKHNALDVTHDWVQYTKFAKFRGKLYVLETKDLIVGSDEFFRIQNQIAKDRRSLYVKEGRNTAQAVQAKKVSALSMPQKGEGDPN